MDRRITIEDIEPLVPFSRGSTEIFLTGQWSPRKPFYGEKTSPCREACPVGNDIARAFSAAAQGDFDKALTIFREDNPLPGVCGRVCYHPCEPACNRKPFDEAVNVRGFERYLSDHGRVDTISEMARLRRDERVAVIGSGPAGLSCSYHLSRLGYSVTVFEALPEPGGMLMYGIPEYRLPKQILRREIDHIRRLGVDIRTGIRVGKDLSISAIRDQYQAVFLAPGAHEGLRLANEADNLPGVRQGIAFLREVNLGTKVEIGRRVAVIGGGNTAIDCARTARRLGAEEVSIIYRRSRAEMPAIPEDIAAVEREGIRLIFLATPLRFVGEANRLTGVECIRMKLDAPDLSGRPRPVPVEGTDFALSVDTVFAAVGQIPEPGFDDGAGFTFTGNGMIKVSPETTATEKEGVFAGGDAAGARAFVADAIASGKKGALAISCYFDGKEVRNVYEALRIGNRSSFSFSPLIETLKNPVDLKRVVPFDKVNTLCFSHVPRTENEEEKGDGDTLTFNEVTGGIRPESMEKEIARCFKCGTCTQCDLCFLICPDISITKAGEEGYAVRKEYCKGCGMCATSCPRQVIQMEVGI